jgi:hypothetical protein
MFRTIVFCAVAGPFLGCSATSESNSGTCLDTGKYRESITLSAESDSVCEKPKENTSRSNDLLGIREQPTCREGCTCSGIETFRCGGAWKEVCPNPDGKGDVTTEYDLRRVSGSRMDGTIRATITSEGASLRCVYAWSYVREAEPVNANETRAFID